MMFRRLQNRVRDDLIGRVPILLPLFARFIMTALSSLSLFGWGAMRIQVSSSSSSGSAEVEIIRLASNTVSSLER